MEYRNFPGIHPISLHLVIGTLCFSLPSSQIEMHVTIGLGISVSENKIYITKFMYVGYLFENYTCPTPSPFQGRIQRGWANTHTDVEKNKATFKCIAIIHALQCKANFINNYF